MYMYVPPHLDRAVRVLNSELGRRGEMAHLRFVDLLQAEGILAIMFTLDLSKTGDLDS